MELNGSGVPGTLVAAPTNFITPLYSINTTNLRQVPEKELSTRGINPGDYITIPDDLRRKSAYRTKTIGANYVVDSTDDTPVSAPVQIYESDINETVSNPEFESAKVETVSRKYIDSVEIEE